MRPRLRMLCLGKALEYFPVQDGPQESVPVAVTSLSADRYGSVPMYNAPPSLCGFNNTAARTVSPPSDDAHVVVDFLRVRFRQGLPRMARPSHHVISSQACQPTAETPGGQEGVKMETHRRFQVRSHLLHGPDQFRRKRSILFHLPDSTPIPISVFGQFHRRQTAFDGLHHRLPSILGVLAASRRRVLQRKDAVLANSKRLSEPEVKESTIVLS